MFDDFYCSSVFIVCCVYVGHEINTKIRKISFNHWLSVLSVSYKTQFVYESLSKNIVRRTDTKTNTCSNIKFRQKTIILLRTLFTNKSWLVFKITFKMYLIFKLLHNCNIQPCTLDTWSQKHYKFDIGVVC